MRIIGIDPGKSGGIAVVFIGNGETSAWPMPATTCDIWERLVAIAGVPDFRLIESRAYIEKVGAMPKQGVKSVWTFAQNYGQLLMALTALDIRHELVHPSKWQRALGCLSKGDKNATKAAAQRLFPSLRITHAIADALLIAEYGRRIEAERCTRAS